MTKYCGKLAAVSKLFVMRRAIRTWRSDITVSTRLQQDVNNSQEDNAQEKEETECTATTLSRLKTSHTAYNFAKWMSQGGNQCKNKQFQFLTFSFICFVILVPLQWQTKDGKWEGYTGGLSAQLIRDFYAGKPHTSFKTAKTSSAYIVNFLSMTWWCAG